ncbi:unnamed protein product, partial [marine sediment metagenome]
PELTLVIYRYDSADGKWEPLTGQIIDPDNNMIMADAPAFSIFGTAGIPTGSTGSSGKGGGGGWCGYIGLEPLILIGIIRFLRRRRKSRAK